MQRFERIAELQQELVAASRNAAAAAEDAARQATSAYREAIRHSLAVLTGRAKEHETQLRDLAALRVNLDSLLQSPLLKEKRAELVLLRNRAWAEEYNLEAKMQLSQTTPEQLERVISLFVRRLPGLQLVGFLGAGGMGEVWLAEQQGLSRRVAVKLLSEEVAQEPGFAERFRREARALASIDHPHVVKVHDFGELQGVFFLVMEFHPGNLRERMQEGPMRLVNALDVMLPLCEAVSAVHAAGLVHRDLKPENVLLNEDGLKLTDFGLARAGVEAGAGAAPGAVRAGGLLTEAGAIVGTPRYMAPEQWKTPQSVDARADVYALGLILYELLTGTPPRGHYVPPSHVCGDVRLDRIVARALDADPAKRYQSVTELSSDLQQSRKDSRRAAILSDLVGDVWPFVVLGQLAWITAAGSSVACHFTLVLVLWEMLRGWIHPWYAPWTRRLRAVVPASVLALDLIGPAFGLPYPWDSVPLGVAIIETLAMLVGCAAASVLLARRLSRPAGWAAFPVLLGLSLAGFYAPSLQPLGRWMPAVVAALVLSLWLGCGGTFRREPPAPLVESPFGL